MDFKKFLFYLLAKKNFAFYVLITAFGSFLALDQIQASPIINDFLKTISQNSLHLKKIQSEAQASLAVNNSELLIFESTGYLSGSYDNRKTAPTSPFASTDSNALTYGVGWSKLWKQGLSSELSYSLSDSETNFSNRPNFSFLSPQLSLTLKTDLFKDLIYGQYGYLEKENKAKNDLSSIEYQVNSKNILIQALFDLATIMASDEDLSLQNKLCKETRVQGRKLSQKRKRGSISKKEYLLSLRELSQCRAATDQLEKQILELKQSFNSSYSTSFSSYEKIHSDMFFADLETQYNIYNSGKVKVDIEGKGEVRAIQAQLASLNLRDKKLRAQSKSNFALELSAGAVGADNSHSQAHTDVTDLRYPFVTVGLRMDLPLSNRQALAEKQANDYQRKALSYQKDIVLRTNKFRYQTLQKTLKKDFEIFKKYKNSVKLSENILQEARRDFNNGRIDFYNLTEFNKQLIQDQKVLSNHRNQLVVRVVEFLDYYKFFSQFGPGSL